ncbi:hypothetical protein [Romboutsia sp.]|uniref:hypothetical protein n=1 Tax=Romboutsia sp. TaxID=1965302 RepID=UPI003F2E3EDE
MVSNKELLNQMESDMKNNGCIEVETSKDKIMTGYIYNEEGNEEAKVIGIAVNEISLLANQKLINTVIKNKTIEQGIIQTPDNRYYIDMSTGLQTKELKKYKSFYQNLASQDGLKNKLKGIKQYASDRKGLDKINYMLTPVVVRAYFTKDKDLNDWLHKIDLKLYNSLIDEINQKYKLENNTLIKLDNKDELEYIKMSLVYLEPTSLNYAKVFEDLLRKPDMMQRYREGEYVCTENITNVVKQFINTLNISGNCIELGSGYGGLLRNLNSKIQFPKGIEINKSIIDISKLLNLISGKENIEIIETDALNLDEKEKYSLTITDLPVGIKVDSENYSNKFNLAKKSKTINTAELFLEKAINITEDGGYIIAVINDSLLFTKQNQATRNLIKNKTIIKAIISLPSHIQKPYPAAEMSIVIMKKKTNQLEQSQTIYINEINKLDEINNRSKEFSKFMENKLDNTNTRAYEILEESENWTPSYLKIFEKLKSPNRYYLYKLCEVNRKSTKELIDEIENYPYIEVSNIDTDKKILQNVKIIKEIKEDKEDKVLPRAKRLAYPGDIVISTIRPERGAIAIVPGDYEVYVVSNALAVLSPENISSELLYFILCSEKVTKDFAALASGASVPTLSISQLKEYRLPISEIPYKYEDEAKELYEKMISKYSKYKELNTIINEELRKVDVSSYEEYRIEELISYKSSIFLENQKGVKQVKICDLDSGSLYVKNEGLDVVDEKFGRSNLVMGRDILIPRGLDCIERTSVADVSVEGCISNHNIYTYEAKEKVLPEYVAMLFRSDEFKVELEGLVKDGKDKMMLKREVMKLMSVKVPSVKMQQVVVDSVLGSAREISLCELMDEISCFGLKVVK